MNDNRCDKYIIKQEKRLYTGNILKQKKLYLRI